MLLVQFIRHRRLPLQVRLRTGTLAAPASLSATANSDHLRHTQVFDLPVRGMISTVSDPSAERSTISGRQTYFCDAVLVANNGLQRAAIGRCEGDGYPGAHAPDSHTPRVQFP